VLRLEFQLDSLLVWCASAALASWSGRAVHLGWLALGTLMLVMSQAALELADGYYDFVQGAHKRKDGAPTWTGGSGVLAEGRISPRNVQLAAFALGALAAVLFAYVTHARTREGGLFVGIVGAACGAFWSMPPFRLSYRGLGEVLQGLVVGPLMAAQAWVVATGHLDARAFAVGAPFGLLELAMGLSHNIVDREDDARAGKRTLVVRIGAVLGSRLSALALALGLGSLVLLSAMKVAPPAASLVALAVLPLAAWAARLTMRAATNAQALATLARTFPAFLVLVCAAGGTLLTCAPSAWNGVRGVLLVLVTFGALPFMAAAGKLRSPSVYDVGAPFYNLVSRALFFENRVRAEAVRALATEGVETPDQASRDHQPFTVLDLGCGTGFHYPLLGRVLPGARVLGVDPSGPSLEIAAGVAAKAGLLLVPIEGDGASAELPEGRVDAVIATFALSVMPHWKESIARAAETLGKGGTFVILEQQIARSGAWSLARPVFVLVNRVFLGASLERDFAAELRHAGLAVSVTQRGAYVILVGRKPLTT
jgi:1,4-dihydroxy-2-naphthoate octaprenyltransferase